jgi:hypothetical protein
MQIEYAKLASLGAWDVGSVREAPQESGLLYKGRQIWNGILNFNNTPGNMESLDPNKPCEGHSFPEAPPCVFQFPPGPVPKRPPACKPYPSQAPKAPDDETAGKAEQKLAAALNEVLQTTADCDNR